MDRYETAKIYQSRGYIIHPLTGPNSTGASPGKRPILKDWQHKRDKLTDVELIKYFKNGDMNIGLVCGEPSGISILDIDKKTFLGDIIEGVPTDALCASARTPGRMHLLFQHDENMTAWKNHVLGIEMLSTGNNAVMASSIHASGQEYVMYNDNLPPPYFEQVRDNVNKLLATYRQLSTFFGNSRTCFRRILQDAPKNDWHDADNRLWLVAIVADLKAAGAEFKHIEMLARICYGPDYSREKTQTEYDNIVNGRTWKCDTIKRTFVGRVDCDSCNKGITIPNTIEKSTVSSPGDDLPIFYDAVDNSEPKMKPGLEIVDMVTKHIPCVLPDIYDVKKTGEIMAYQGGVYSTPGTHKKIYEYVCKGLGDYYNSSKESEIFRTVASRTVTNNDDIDADLDVIVCENCRINIKTGEITEHDPKYFDTVKIPIMYDKDATCPNFDKFVTEIVNPEWQDVIGEIGGYCLLRESRNEKMIMMLGAGANGKSTLLNIYDKLLGESNTSSLEMQTIENEKFAISLLKGKLANICGDLPKSALKDASVIKRIVSDDPVTADVKNGKHMTFIPYVKLIFAMNRLPPSYDNSDGFYRKILLLNFPNRFEENPEFAKQFDNELPGIFNRMLEGAHRLHENGKFSNDNTPQEIESVYDKETHSAGTFADSEVSRGGLDDFVSIDTLYDSYLIYCMKIGIMAPEKRRAFTNVMNKTISDRGAIKTRHTINGRKVTGYKGITLS